MPLIKYGCECGNLMSKFFRNPKEVPSFVLCDVCKNGKHANRQLSAPNSKSIIVVDNGLQAKRVEVDLELVKDIQERSTKDFKDK